MARLTAAARRQIPRGKFAIPEKAPGSGSYPIEDIGHARNALSRSSGKPEERRVRAAVCREYPALCRARAQVSAIASRLKAM